MTFDSFPSKDLGYAQADICTIKVGMEWSELKGKFQEARVVN